MKQVTRYLCELCGREFKTPDKHKCKWDPKWKNCLSCANRGRFVKGEPTRQIGFGEWEEGISNSFECHGEDYPPAETAQQGGSNDFDCGAVSCAELGCSNWKPLQDYKGKKTYKEVESNRALVSTEISLSAEELHGKTKEELVEMGNRLDKPKVEAKNPFEENDDFPW